MNFDDFDDQNFVEKGKTMKEGYEINEFSMPA